MEAAVLGQAKTLQLLIDAGGDPNSITDDNAWSALALAAEYDHLGCMRVLLAAGADARFDEGNADWALLAVAKQEGDMAMVKLLLRYGAKK
jgi:ankyrin repeat protein